MASRQGIAWIVVVTCLLLGIETTFAIKGALQTNRLRREVSASEQRLNEAAQARHFFPGACGLYWISG